MSTLSDTLSNLLKLGELQPTQPQIESSTILPQSIVNTSETLPQSSDNLPELAPGMVNAEVSTIKDDVLNHLLSKECSKVEHTDITNPQLGYESNPQLAVVQSLTDNQIEESNQIPIKLFSPLRYPERMLSIDDELQLRTYIAEEIDKLDDNGLRQKINVYQRLGVLVRVCESEVYRIGQKRNKKFLENDEDRTNQNLGKIREAESKKSEPRVSAEDKYIAKMMKLGLTKEKAQGLWDLKEGKATAAGIKLNELGKAE